jgi:hypothetical protein
MHLVDEGRFINYIASVLPDQQIRLVGGLTPPLRQIVLVELYDAMIGDNSELHDNLDRLNQRRAGDPVVDTLNEDYD